MEMLKTKRSLGVISNSSLESIELAVITTDGVDVFDFGPSQVIPYDDTIRRKILNISGRKKEEIDNEYLSDLEQQLTKYFHEIITDFIDLYSEKIDIIGFSGPIIHQNPSQCYCHQIGDCKKLSSLLGIQVVSNFRKSDIIAGGQGSPLSAAYHMCLCCDKEKPIVIVNIDGISSIIWIGQNGEVMGFDAGAGCAAINDWVDKHGAQHADYNGRLAITGTINHSILASMMRHKYLAKYPPKSADCSLFYDKLEHLEGLSLADGCATATAYIAETIAYSLSLYIPLMPKEVIICGCGAENPTLMRFLRQRLDGIEVKSAREMGWKSEVVEAQAAAYIAVRRFYQMPVGIPTVTGVPEPIICGEIFLPQT